ncbi:SRPBCC domain-containing protein [Listeria costaricensis]|uniref:SRPBCC domain-containing protein n=1 Tax=Listeria costaricensis TaxID=2026604 RepID=UPI000C0884FE|nr:SRPBCC domain-containing protein [Listeria costaricensis]
MKTFSYVTYIQATKESLWDALTDGEKTAQYFFGSKIRSTFQVGEPVEYLRDGQVTDFGTILTCEENRCLRFTWSYVGQKVKHDPLPIVSFQIQPLGEVVRLTLTHEHLLAEDFETTPNTVEGYNNGWPVVLSSLKTFLETGVPLGEINFDKIRGY